ncbi:hypothetical protein [Spongiimicrobium salis]|uniref:hypothetical protein n=1 Tax=Spongiimicrobium salis TaxID=1667022 RepID=UPI00374D6EB6
MKTMITILQMAIVLSCFTLFSQEDTEKATLTLEKDSVGKLKIVYQYKKDKLEYTANGEVHLVGRGFKLIDKIKDSVYSLYFIPTAKGAKCKKIDFDDMSYGDSFIKKGDQLQIYKNVKVDKGNGCPISGTVISLSAIAPKDIALGQVETKDPNKSRRELNPIDPKTYKTEQFFPKQINFAGESTLITYDFLNPKPKNRRLKPDENVAFRFLNYEKKYKSISITPSFENYNLEGQQQFIDLLGLDKKEEKEVNEDKTAKPTAAGVKDTLATNTEKYINDFETQLEKYVYQLKTTTKYSLEVEKDLNDALDKYAKIFEISSNLLVSEFQQVLEKLNFYEDHIKLIMSNLYYLNNYSNGISLPIQVKDADALKLDIKATKSDGTEVDLNSFTYRIKCGFKIDFSTGFVLSYLTDDKFQIVDVSAEQNMDMNGGGDMMTRQRVIEANSDPFNFGISLMAHAYTRWFNYVNPVVSFGFVLDNSNIVSFPIGLGATIGRESRIVISSGVVFGRVERLLPKYTLNEAMDSSFFSGVNDEQLTSDVFRARPFISLTYNFAGTGEKK